VGDMTRLRLDAPAAVRWIARTLEEHGFETWTVGGAVRDALLGRPSGDWDFATRAHPKDVRRVFKRTVPIGVDHGTMGVLAKDGTLYEVTTFRRDVVTDGRHAVVSFADRLEDDLARRDFTINAIAWHPLTERIFDPFDGRVDLERSVLRTVGQPDERFREDYLRVLRALRFAGRFGLAIEPATWAAITAVPDRLSALSAERIRDELLKILDTDPVPSRSLDLYRASGVLGALFPELQALADGGNGAGSRSGSEDDAPGRLGGWGGVCAVVDALPTGRGLLRLAALARPLRAEAAAALLVRLRLSNVQTDRTLRRATAPAIPGPDEPDAAFRRWLGRVGPEDAAAVARLDLARAVAGAPSDDQPSPVRIAAAWNRARAVRATRPPLSVGDLALDGRGLIALGLRPGPRFGTILEGLLDWVLEDPERNRQELLVARVLEAERVDG